MQTQIKCEPIIKTVPISLFKTKLCNYRLQERVDVCRNFFTPWCRLFLIWVAPIKADSTTWSVFTNPFKNIWWKIWKILALVFTISMMKIIIVLFNALTTFILRHFPEYFPRKWNTGGLYLNGFSNNITGRVVCFEKKKTIKICRVFLFLTLHTF